MPVLLMLLGATGSAFQCSSAGFLYVMHLKSGTLDRDLDL